MQGRVLQAVTRYAGTSTVGIEAIGQTIISVDSIADFPMESGFVVISGVVYSYTSVDRVNSTITLSTGLPSQAQAGTDVLIFPVSAQRWAFVESDAIEVPADAVWVLIPHALAGFIAADGLRALDVREVVTYQRLEDELVVVDVKDRLPQITSAAIPNGIITETKVSPGSITTPLLATNAVATQNLQAGSVKADNIDLDTLTGKVITGALIRSAATGRRVELSNSGLIQVDASGNVILTIGDVNKFTGEIDATSMIIRDSLQLFGRNNLFAVGSKITLKASVGAPSQAPTLSWDYQSGPVLDSGWFQTGVHTKPGALNQSLVAHYFGNSEFKNGSGGTYQWPQILNTGTADPVDTTASFKPQSYTRIATAAGIELAVMIGEDYAHMNGSYPETWIHVYNDSAMVANGSVAPTLVHSMKWRDFSWFKQYKLVRIVRGLTSSRSQFGILEADAPLFGGNQRLQYTSYDIVSATNSSIPQIGYADFGNILAEGETLAGGVDGNRANLMIDGVGTNSILVLMTSLQNKVYNWTAGLWESDSYFPATYNTQDRTWLEGDVVNNTGTAYYSYNYAAGTDSKTYKYADNHKKIATITNFWGAYAWRGESAQAFKTVKSPAGSIGARKMARLRVTMPALPAPIAGVGAARDPAKDVYGWIYYLGSGATEPANAALWTQSNQPAMAPNVAMPETSIALATYPVFSGSNPSTTNTFPAAQAATIESDNGMLKIDGDGNILGNNVQATGTLQVTGTSTLGGVSVLSGSAAISQVSQSADFTLTDTITALPGMSITKTITAGQVVHIIMSLDIDSISAFTVANLFVDGAAFGGGILINGPNGGRTCSTKNWVLIGLSAGSHTFTARANKSGTAGTIIRSVHSSMSADIR